MDMLLSPEMLGTPEAPVLGDPRGCACCCDVRPAEEEEEEEAPVLGDPLGCDVQATEEGAPALGDPLGCTCGIEFVQGSD